MCNKYCVGIYSDDKKKKKREQLKDLNDLENNEFIC